MQFSQRRQHGGRLGRGGGDCDEASVDGLNKRDECRVSRPNFKKTTYAGNRLHRGREAFSCSSSVQGSKLQGQHSKGAWTGSKDGALGKPVMHCSGANEKSQGRSRKLGPASCQKRGRNANSALLWLLHFLCVRRKRARRTNGRASRQEARVASVPRDALLCSRSIIIICFQPLGPLCVSVDRPLQYQVAMGSLRVAGTVSLGRALCLIPFGAERARRGSAVRVARRHFRGCGGSVLAALQRALPLKYSGAPALQ